MPTSYTIDNARGLVVSRFWGVLTDDQVRGHRRDLSTDPAFDPSFHHLADMRELVVAAVSDATITEVARESVFRRGARRAFVLDEVQYRRSGLARLFKEYAKQAPGQQIKVFHELGAAERWVEFGDA
jgi:hypothetical protein